MFAEKLNKILEEYKISRYRMAKDLKVSQQTVANWCYGLSEPKAKQIVIICKYLDVSSDYLLGLTDTY
ncbi:MAG: helix-turn-helix domain-containing protein [Clostridia bacterium]|nr:helix-turn-helix domain-containing protein [Clostridia bacterium]